jgi:hypothetical protein
LRGVGYGFHGDIGNGDKCNISAMPIMSRYR